MLMDKAHMTNLTVQESQGQPEAVSRASRAVQIIFVALCALCVLLPLVGMLWAQTNETTENRRLAEMPEITSEDGSFNVDILSDLGAYFEDHFAYRNELVALNAYLRTGLTATSPAPSVIYGQNGRLFYEGTLDDYTGAGTLSERGAENVAFNLMLMQGYVEAQGASFLFAIAPNKNSLYPENMPYYEIAGADRTVEKLEPLLEEQDVRYADLFSLFNEHDEDLYYLRDSHWNTKGALLVSDELIDELGRIQFGALPDAEAGERVDGYVGDLNKMLYPAWQIPEEDIAFEGLTWSFVESDAVDESWIETESGLGSHQVIEADLLMYRDSFANNLIPFLSTAYERAYYSKWVPYDLTQVAALGVRDVIIERAERHIGDLNESPAIMPAPRYGLDLDYLTQQGDLLAPYNVHVEEDGPYYRIEGALPQECGSDTEIYLEVSDGKSSMFFVPFHVTTEGSDFGFVAYLEKSAVAEGAACMVYGIDGSDIIAQGDIVLKEESQR